MWADRRANGGQNLHTLCTVWSRRLACGRTSGRATTMFHATCHRPSIAWCLACTAWLGLRLTRCRSVLTPPTFSSWHEDGCGRYECVRSGRATQAAVVAGARCRRLPSHAFFTTLTRWQSSHARPPPPPAHRLRFRWPSSPWPHDLRRLRGGTSLRSRVTRPSDVPSSSRSSPSACRTISLATTKRPFVRYTWVAASPAAWANGGQTPRSASSRMRTEGLAWPASIPRRTPRCLAKRSTGPSVRCPLGLRPR
mmetsp:Transcript_12827/g.40514  ORF Transcript_12827/g.40514 Transcript_12827/m.40514 type:complete len:252 (-) Transcript_12827:308-1063(-)